MNQAIEITLIFFVLFVISLSLVNIFSSLQSSAESNIKKMMDKFYENWAYTTIQILSTENISITISKFGTIIGSSDKLVFRKEGFIYEFNIKSEGACNNICHLYNFNGTIYIT